MESSNLVFVLKLCYKDRQREYSIINFRVHPNNNNNISVIMYVCKEKFRFCLGVFQFTHKMI